MAKMVLKVQKNLKLTHFYMLNIFCLNNFPKISSPGGILALGLLLAVYGPGLGPNGPRCLKNLKLTQFYMLNILCYNNFAQKSSPGGVLALRLLLAVYGPGLGLDGPGCPQKP